MKKKPVVVNKAISIEKLLDRNKYKLENFKKKYENIKVACILDEFSYECFKYECNLIPLTPKNWREILEREKPDLLFVESAWEGLNGEWSKKIINPYIKRDDTLKNVVYEFKKYNIPTVFWCKEDPVDFNIFINAAKYFDYVFTTDSNCIQNYKQVLGHDNVDVLPFAAQPKIHNPILKDEEKIGKVAFAGGWYEKKLNKRKENMYKILPPAFKYDLCIYDRFSKNNNKFNEYPKEFRPYIKEGLPYNEIIKEYKKYHIFLNVNSVDTSPTTFSRRVFELLACGTPIISSYAVGIENFFNKIVKMCKSEREVEKYLSILLRNKELRDRLSLLGQRQVFCNHTYGHRIEKVLDTAEIDYIKNKGLGVSVITCTKRLKSIENVFNNYISQTYPKKELIIILNNNDADIDKWKKKAHMFDGIRVFQLDEGKSLGQCLNFGVEKARYEIISKFDDDDYYAPNYLLDIMNTFKYVDADIVGKKSVYAHFEDSNILALRHPKQEYQYVYFIFGATLNVKKKVFNNVKFQNLSSGEDTEFLISCLRKGYKIYSTDRFNFLVSRRACLEEHSWKVTQEEFLKGSQIIHTDKLYKDFITV